MPMDGKANSINRCIPQILISKMWYKSRYNTSHSGNTETYTFIKHILRTRYTKIGLITYMIILLIIL